MILDWKSTRKEKLVSCELGIRTFATKVGESALSFQIVTGIGGSEKEENLTWSTMPLLASFLPPFVVL